MGGWWVGWVVGRMEGWVGQWSGGHQLTKVLLRSGGLVQWERYQHERIECLGDVLARGLGTDYNGFELPPKQVKDM